MSIEFIGTCSLRTPASQICTAAQFAEDDFLRLIGVLQQQPRLHRKQWEYAYILRVLEACGLLQSGKTALGLRCRSDPIAAVLASRGLSVTATERPDLAADGRAPEFADVFYGGICDEDLFRQRVSVESLDVGALPDRADAYDIIWGCSAIEELGTVAAGIDYVCALGGRLRSGGVAVFTTQFNLGSDIETIERPGLAVWRRLDILDLQARLIGLGLQVLPLVLTAGTLPEDSIVDVAPYTNPVHLKLEVEGHTLTSLGLALRRP